MSTRQETELHNTEITAPAKTGAELRLWAVKEFSVHADEKYKIFHERLIPGTTMGYGVRVPEIRKISRSILRQNPLEFIAACKYESYEETQLCGLVIAGVKLELNKKLSLVTDFLPHIDNWAICDTFCAAFRIKPSEKPAFLTYLLPLLSCSHPYFVRTAVVMLLFHYIDDAHIDELLQVLSGVSHQDYYVKMAVAWAISLCYIKFPKQTGALLRKKQLEKFTQNKAIQKIRESYRVPQMDKDLLLAYKR